MNIDIWHTNWKLNKVGPRQSKPKLRSLICITFLLSMLWEFISGHNIILYYIQTFLFHIFVNNVKLNCNLALDCNLFTRSKFQYENSSYYLLS